MSSVCRSSTVWSKEVGDALGVMSPPRDFFVDRVGLVGLLTDRLANETGGE